METACHSEGAKRPWESPGTVLVPAQHFGGWYGINALAMTTDRGIRRPHKSLLLEEKVSADQADG